MTRWLSVGATQVATAALEFLWLAIPLFTPRFLAAILLQKDDGRDLRRSYMKPDTKKGGRLPASPFGFLVGPIERYGD